MKRRGILHATLARVVAELGHTDTLVVCDAGLPIPKSSERIDLALVPGVPTFAQVVQALGEEIAVERIVLAEECRTANPAVIGLIEAVFPGVPVEYVPHEEFKKESVAARAFVRTGEVTPYANVILQSGVEGVIG